MFYERINHIFTIYDVTEIWLDIFYEPGTFMFVNKLGYNIGGRGKLWLIWPQRFKPR